MTVGGFINQDVMVDPDTITTVQYDTVDRKSACTGKVKSKKDV